MSKNYKYRELIIRCLPLAAFTFTTFAVQAENPVTGSGYSPLEYRTIDGWNNNLLHPDMNATDTPLMRHMYATYDDGVSQMAGGDRPNPRSISNIVNDQAESKPNQHNVTSYLWVWGQFLDHDMDLTEGAEPHEPANIPIPIGDPWFDPGYTGTGEMTFSRSAYDHASGYGIDNPREQMNQITGWIDASMVYGSDAVRAAALRTNDGTGRMKTSAGNLLPYNIEGFPNAGGAGPHLFLAGDVRANENVALTAMHTVFVREHNRIADLLREWKPWLEGEEIYQRTRHIVAAEIQLITYKEFLPALLGKDLLPSYYGYSRHFNGSIRNEFSTAAFRLGHSLLNPVLPRLNKYGEEVEAGSLSLSEAFFAPHEVQAEGIASVLRGLATQRSENIDVYVIDDVRNFLFGPPPAGFDLASLNIQRGRDHGMPGYNEARTSMGLAPAVTFADITSDTEVQQRLAEAYPTPDYVDIWVGGLAEDHVSGAMVGELFHEILYTQFVHLAKSDRFLYSRSLSLLDWLLMGDWKLGAIIKRNTDVGYEIHKDVFHMHQPRWFVKW